MADLAGIHLDDRSAEMCPRLQKAVLDQAVDGLAHRGAADPEALGDPCLDDPLALWQVSVQDRLAPMVINLIRDRRPLDMASLRHLHPPPTLPATPRFSRPAP